jgi:hypothetical protein
MSAQSFPSIMEKYHSALVLLANPYDDDGEGVIPSPRPPTDILQLKARMEIKSAPATMAITKGSGLTAMHSINAKVA